MGIGVIILIFGILTWIFAIGMPADSKDVAITTEFQRPGDYGLTESDFDKGYLKQEWVIHFELTNGKALNARNKYTYGKNENGDTIVTGCIMTLYEVQPSALFECDNYTTGYSYGETEAPPSGFDYTFTVRYKDKEVVYSMREEGLF